MHLNPHCQCLFSHGKRNVIQNHIIGFLSNTELMTLSNENALTDQSYGEVAKPDVDIRIASIIWTVLPICSSKRILKSKLI